jgi:hypothetical protein
LFFIFVIMSINVKLVHMQSLKMKTIVPINALEG